MPVKKFFIFLLLVLITISLPAQVPQKLSYQFVVRNASGSLVTNAPVGVRVAILQGSTTGAVVYHELFNPNPITNLNGLVSIEIGTGLPITGTFSAINWAGGPYFLKTETDPSGGTSYTVVGTSQLLSVPYALYSVTAENIPNNSVTSAKIVDGTIAAADLGTGSVSSAKIADATIATGDLADGSVTTSKIADGNVITSDLADGSVTTSKIADGNVVTSNLMDNSVTSAKIVDGAIITNDIANSAITTAKISNSGADANEVLQYTGSAVTWGYAPGTEIKIAVINVTGTSSISITSTYAKQATLGTFSKLSGDSKLEITFHGRIFVGTLTGSGAYFELRVDDNPTTLGGRTLIKSSEAGGSDGIPVSMTAIFTGLGAGTRTISIWIKTTSGTGTTAMVNPGNYSSDYLIIREIQ